MTVDFSKLREEHIRLLQKRRKNGALDRSLEDDALELFKNLSRAVLALDESLTRQRLESYATFWASSLAETTGLYPKPVDASVAPSTGTRPFMAPEASSPNMTGRRKFYHDLKQALFAGRNLALFGRPGLGKTNLAAQLAHDPDVREQFPDGVLWANLGEDPDTLSLLSIWGEKLGILKDLTGFIGVEERMRALRDAIGVRRMLLIADDACDSDSARTMKCGGPNCVHILTTYLYTVAIDFDPQATTLVPALDEEDGLRLLECLIPRVSSKHDRHVKELVQVLEGVPMALTLVGKTLLQNGSAPLSRSLEVTLGRLRQAKENFFQKQVHPPRSFAGQSGLRLEAPLALLTAIHCSFNTLQDEEQKVLQALSAFRPKANSFSKKAAIAVSGSTPEVLETLAQTDLIEKTRTNRDTSREDDSVRFTVHRAIHQYLENPLDPLPDTKQWEELIEHYILLLEGRHPTYAPLDEDERNVFLVLDKAYVLARQPDQKEALSRRRWSLVLRGGNAFFGYLDRRGLFSEAERYLGNAQEAASKLADERGRATALLHLGDVEEKLGKNSDAADHLGKALELAEDHGDLDMQCRALWTLGVVALNQTNYEQAESYLLRGLKKHEELVEKGQGADPGRKCEILTRLGWVACSRGKDKVARAYALQASKEAERANDPVQIAMVRLDMGVLAYLQERYERALRLDTEALNVAEHEKERKLECAAHQALVGVETKLQRYDRAAQHAQEALRLARQIGHQWYQGITYKELGELRLEEGKLSEATPSFVKAIDVAGRIGSRDLVAFALYGLARVAYRSGNNSEARRQGYSSLQLFEEIGHRKAVEVKSWLSALEKTQEGGPVSGAAT
jgi:tetratricopeptide (TPR) repeat protein